MRRTSLALLALLALLATAVAPVTADAAEPESSVTLSADAGFPGGLNGTFPVTLRLEGDARVVATIADPSAEGARSLVLEPWPSIELSIGSFPDAVGERPEFTTPTGPLLRLVTVAGAVCPTTLQGSFAVTDVRVSRPRARGGRTLARLRATFEFRCAVGGPVQRGELRLLSRFTDGRPIVETPSDEWSAGVADDGGMAWAVYRRRVISRSYVRSPTSRHAEAIRGVELTDLSGDVLVGDRRARGRAFDVVAFGYPDRAARRVPAGINTAATEYGATTDGRYWQFARRKGADVSLHVVDTTTGRARVLQRGRLSPGGVRDGVSAWSSCSATGRCVLHVLELATGRRFSVEPPRGRAYYGATAAPDGAVYAVDGSARICTTAHIVQIDTATGHVRRLRTFRGDDAEQIRVARIGPVHRLNVTRRDCPDRQLLRDVMELEVDPPTLQPLVETLPS